MTEKPFSQACENNKWPIAEHLASAFAQVDEVLEVGSGTGQHAVYMAQKMPWLQWQTADRLAHHGGIHAWLADSGLGNAKPPLELDIGGIGWPASRPYPAIFSANTLHIMNWQAVEQFFAGLEQSLSAGGVLCVYGPFNYGGSYTSASNARFDQWLKEAPGQGIRDFEAIAELADAQGLQLQADHAMPANNRLLQWLKQ